MVSSADNGDNGLDDIVLSRLSCRHPGLLFKDNHDGRLGSWELSEYLTSREVAAERDLPCVIPVS